MILVALFERFQCLKVCVVFLKKKYFRVFFFDSDSDTTSTTIVLKSRPRDYDTGAESADELDDAEYDRQEALKRALHEQGFVQSVYSLCCGYTVLVLTYFTAAIDSHSLTRLCGS